MKRPTLLAPTPRVKCSLAERSDLYPPASPILWPDVVHIQSRSQHHPRDFDAIVRATRRGSEVIVAQSRRGRGTGHNHRVESHPRPRNSPTRPSNLQHERVELSQRPRRNHPRSRLNFPTTASKSRRNSPTIASKSRRNAPTIASKSRGGLGSCLYTHSW